MSAVEGLEAPISVAPVTTDHRPGTLAALCPYLATLDGNWRSATAVREHRCMAVSPPVQLAAEKQRRLCLTDHHVDCATYDAAVAARSLEAGRPAAHARPVARMTPVILDHGRFDLRIPALRADRASGQAALVVVLAIAFLGILLARPSGNAGETPQGSSPAPALAGASAGPTSREAAASRSADVPGTTVPAETNAAPTSQPSAGESAGPRSAAPSPATSAAPVTSGATYKVKSGDTLSAIAARFDTTTRVLVQLNNISDPSKLKVGQILKLP